HECCSRASGGSGVARPRKSGEQPEPGRATHAGPTTSQLPHPRLRRRDADPDGGRLQGHRGHQAGRPDQGMENGGENGDALRGKWWKMGWKMVTLYAASVIADC